MRLKYTVFYSDFILLNNSKMYLNYIYKFEIQCLIESFIPLNSRFKSKSPILYILSYLNTRKILLKEIVFNMSKSMYFSCILLYGKIMLMVKQIRITYDKKLKIF